MGFIITTLRSGTVSIIRGAEVLGYNGKVAEAGETHNSTGKDEVALPISERRDKQQSFGRKRRVRRIHITERLNRVDMSQNN